MNINQETQKKEKEKKRVLESAKKLSDVRDEIIDLFEKGTFPYKGNVFQTKKKEKSEEESEEESEENKLEKIKNDYNKFFEYIENESKSINYELFEKHFSFVVPSALAKKLFEAREKKKNNDFVKLIKIRWSNLKDEIKKMPKDEKKLNNQIKY